MSFRWFWLRWKVLKAFAWLLGLRVYMDSDNCASSVWLLRRKPPWEGRR